MSTKRLLLILAGAVAISGAIGFRVFAWPSIAFPDTDPAVIEARWNEVERRAAVFGAPTTDGAQLLAATAALDEWPEVRDELARGSDSQSIAPMQLTPAGRRAVDALRRWAAEDGDVPDHCVEGPSPALDLLHLGRLAMRSSETAADPSFAAALRLGAALRRREPLIGGLVGFGLADSALELARARGWDLELPAAHRPTAEELRTLVARESVCAYRVVERAFKDSCDRRDQAGSLWFNPLSPERWCQRERQVFKDYWGALHEAADKHTDLRAFADALAVDQGAFPQSPTVRATAISMDGPVRDAIDLLAKYDALPAATR